MTPKKVVAAMAASLAAIGVLAAGCTSDERPEPSTSAPAQDDAQDRKQVADEFVQRYNRVGEYDTKITTALAELADAQGREEDLDPYREKVYDATNLCLTSVAEYDALVNDRRKAQWQPKNLPAVINTLDPATDCQASENAPSPIPEDPDQPETGAGEPSPTADN